jgi:hypothetical protein
VPHQLGDRDAVGVGQLGVEQHDVRPQIADQAQSFLAGTRVSHVPQLRLAAQRDTEQVREGLVAVDDEHGDTCVTHSPPPQ